MTKFTSKIESERDASPSTQKFLTSEKQKATIERLMLKAADGNDDAREKLIKLIIPYVESVVDRFAGAEFGRENVDDNLVKEKSEEIIAYYLSEDNYQDTLKQYSGKWHDFRKAIYLKSYREFNDPTYWEKSLPIMVGKDNFYTYLKDEERATVFRLIDKINKGKENALGELIGMIKPHVEKAAKNIARTVIDEKIDADLISEAVTNTLHELFLNREKPLSLGFVQWFVTYHLHSELKNIVMLRQNSKDDERDFAVVNQPSRDTVFDVRNTNHSPEDELVIKQARINLEKALASLTPTQRNILESRYIGGMSNREIAEKYECSHQYIAIVEQNAINILRKSAKQYGIHKNTSESKKERAQAMHNLKDLYLVEGKMIAPPSEMPYEKYLRKYRSGATRPTEPDNTNMLPSVSEELANLSDAEILRIIRESDPTQRAR